ncbi:MAG: hypothetical protein K0R29_394 [Pseudobdellovibrio sp.]|nr:hypothetical protein [Pseudobdellovibrio sp.]
MKPVLGILLLFFAEFTFAQSSCIKLENLSLGCVSSIDHSCFRNKKLDESMQPCRYVAEPNTMWRVEAPISFHCKSSESTTSCTPEVCNGDKCTPPICVTKSECVEYFPPTCDEQCVTCFDQVVLVNVGVTKGCIICTRNECPDEVPARAKTFCPSKYNNMINSPAQKCSTESRCPTTAVDNLGRNHEVIIRRGTCPPPQMPPEPTPEQPIDCPWKVDERTENGCERIRCDNQNPSAAPGCVDP